MGRPEDGTCQPMSIIFTITNVDIKSFYKFIEGGKDSLAYNRYEKALKIAKKK